MNKSNTNTISYGSTSSLRILTCGDAGVGKSTLIIRLLGDKSIGFASKSNQQVLDEIIYLKQQGEVDFHSDHQSEKILDISKLSFSLNGREVHFIDNIQDYLQFNNLATAARRIDLALFLVDASTGILSETYRQIYIAYLLGIRNVLIVVNKVDVVDYQKAAFEAIQQEFVRYTSILGEGVSPFEHTTIPVSALYAENVTSSSKNMPWYNGKTILNVLKTIQNKDLGAKEPFRMLVDSAASTDTIDTFCSGRIWSGAINQGEKIKVFPGAIESKVKQILVSGELTNFATAGQSAKINLCDEVHFSPSSVVASAENPCEVADQFDTTILWMADDPLLPGRTYFIECGNQSAHATITALKYKVNVLSLAHEPLTKLDSNEIGECNVAVDSQLAFDNYKDNKVMGSFLLIDRLSKKTVGIGLIRFALTRASNIHWQSLDVDKKIRSVQKKQTPTVLWFTGLSGSGKSTIANILERKLAAVGKHTYCLDGDNVRHGLNKDLGFTDADRVENIRRVTEVSKLMLDAGLITLVSFISPFRSERRMARNAMEDGEFLEIFVDTPLDVAEKRDVKGLYKKARAGEIKNFTGIDSVYESPLNPEIQLNTVEISAEEAAEKIIRELEDRNIL